MDSTVSMICQALRRCRVATTSALYSAASSTARSVGVAGSTTSAATHSAAPGPVTPDRGHRPERGVAVIQTRGEQQLPVGASPRSVDSCLGRFVQFDRHHHAGKYHLVRQREDRQAQSFSHVNHSES